MNIQAPDIKWYHRHVFKFIWLVFILFLIQIGFGSYGIVLKALAAQVDPLVFSMFRDAACFPLLYVVALLVEGFHKINAKHIPLFFGLGLTGMFGNQVFYIYGLYFTSPTIASVFQPMIPVITAALAMITGIEKFEYKQFTNWAKIWGICTSGGGAIIMVMSKSSSPGTSGATVGFFVFIGKYICDGNLCSPSKKVPLY